MANGSVRIIRNDTARVIAQVRGTVGNAVRRITLDLLSQSVRRAPVDEGPLRGSGSAHFNGERIATGADFDSLATGSDAMEGGGGSDVTTGVVAFNTVYAVEQHERTEFHHPKGGEAKYLERPLEENRALYTKTIADAVVEGLR